MEGELATPEVVRIRPPHRWVPLDFAELWHYRELLFFFTWRDIKVRYAQTVLGAAWAVLQPLLTMVAFSVFFGKLARIPSDGVPYPLFSFAALVPWSLHAQGITSSSNSLVASANLIRKVYFPRLLSPASTVLASFVDFAIAFAVLGLMMAGYGYTPTANVVWLPLLLLLLVLTTLGSGLWLSAINVRYRDVRYTVPFLTQLWMFVTPIAYPTTLVHEEWRPLYALNPMVGVVEGFRWALLGTATDPREWLGSSFLAATALFVSGMYFFRRAEQTFADVV